MSGPFPWRAGMRAIDKNGTPWRIYQGAGGLCAQGEPAGYCGDWEGIAPLLEAKPDPDDGGTRGAFLEAIREAFKDPGLGISYSEDYRRWQVSRTTRKCFAEIVATAKTEFKALQAAWDAYSFPALPPPVRSP